MSANRDADFARVTIANGVFFIGIALFLILPRRLVELGADPRQVGLYMGLSGAAPLVLMPLVGVLADRHGTQRFLLWGYVLSIAAVLGYFRMDHLGPYLALLRVAGGAGFALLWVAGSVFAARVAPPGKLAQRVGVFGAATLCTHAIGPPLGEWLIGRWGWGALYGTSAALMAAGFIGVLGIADPPPVPRSDVSILDVVRGASWRPLFAALLAAMAWGAMFNLLPAATAARGARVAPFFTAYAAAALTTRFGIGDLADRFGRQRVAVPALCGFAGAIALSGLAKSALALVGIGIGFGLSHGIHYPALAALALDEAPAAARGRAMALFTLAFNFGSASGAMGLGALAKAAGYAPMFAVAGGVCVLAVPLLLQSRGGHVT